LYSYFALSDTFSTVWRASGPVFMFCAPWLIFGGNEGDGSHFHVLRYQTRFRQHRGRHPPFSCLALPDSFSTKTRVPGTIFMFCPRVVSRLKVLRSRTHFRRHYGPRVSFSCFVLPDSFSAISRASGPVIMICASGLGFGGTDGVRSRFHALRSGSCFLWCRVRRDPFSCFMRPDSFKEVPRASCLVFMFCASGLVFGGTEGVRSRFHVLRSRICFRRYQGRRVPFLSFALPDSFSAVPRASAPVFMFCAPGLVFDSTEGIGSNFHVFRPRPRFRRKRGCRVPFSCFALPESFPAVPRASGLVFIFCMPGLIFGGNEAAGYRFHVLRSRGRFLRFRGSRVPFSTFAIPDTFLAVMRASGPVFMFGALELVFGCTKGNGSNFHVLRAGRDFWRYRGRQVPFSWFALPNSFSAVPRAFAPFVMFCAPGLVFGGNEGVGYRFHVLRSRNHFRRFRGQRVSFLCFARRTSFWGYRGRQLSFSCFACPDSFLAAPRALGPIFMFCTPELIFGGTEGVGSCFLVFRSLTRF
jgi:hypothetical protein